MDRVRWPSVVEASRAMVAGYPDGITLRQLYYLVVSAGLIPHEANFYRRLSKHVALARRAGTFPDLLDPLRRVHVADHWRDVADFAEEMPDWFRLDRTRGQEHALYLAAEKDTLRMMCTDVVFDLGVPVLVVRGYASQTYVKEVRRRVRADPRPAVLQWVGDFDASGEDVERDFLERTACWSRVDRIAPDRAHPRPGRRARPATRRWEDRGPALEEVRRPP